MTATVPAGINYENISRYFAEHVPGGDAPLEVSLISGGKSNLTYKIASSSRAWVLRRPPLGHVLPTAHDMRREYNVLTGLSATDVPVPHTVAICEDNEVNGAPFYIMDYCEGVILAEELPDWYAKTPEERYSIGMGMIRTMAQLHAVDYDAVGLSDFGHPEGYLERQVRRWHQQWEASVTRPVPEIDEVARRLRNGLPESPAPTIVHGDFRLGNLMLDANDPSRVVAILDWEMSTLGDPLSDLGYTLLYWTEPGDPPVATTGGTLTTAPGFASRQQLIDEYARLSGRSVEHVDFYLALAAYKLAIIVEGIHRRFVEGLTVGEGFEGYGDRAVNLARHALTVTQNSSNPKLRGE